jgi:hypothetical protein
MVIYFLSLSLSLSLSLTLSLGLIADWYSWNCLTLLSLLLLQSLSVLPLLLLHFCHKTKYPHPAAVGQPNMS